MKGKVAENQNVYMRLEGDVLFGKYLTDRLTLEVAKDVLDLQYKNFGADIKYVITDLTNIKAVTKEARDYFTRDEFTKGVRAAAFIAPTIIHKLILTFYNTFNKPVVPSAYFTNLQDARNWIKKHQKAQQKLV